MCWVCAAAHNGLKSIGIPFWCLLLAQQAAEVTPAAYRGFWCLRLAFLRPAASLLSPLLALAPPPLLGSVSAGNSNLRSLSPQLLKQNSTCCLNCYRSVLGPPLADQTCGIPSAKLAPLS